jgi:alkanesulfonate monooxygenase SsuD/methylene tetrahydromethanopterin reductase-like flavin-dependent oxidoreductase (luciferase family)
MKFGFLSELEIGPRQSFYDRYWEVLEEVELADQMGFDFFGTSEQHFLAPIATGAAPEPFYGAVAMRTKQIKIRNMICLTASPFNNPVRVAEWVATLDILSKGRVEFGVGRGNTWVQAEAFGVPLDETRERMAEGLDVVVKAWTNDPFSYKGKFFQFPPRSVVPKLVQKPHPPLWMAAVSPESHTLAGKLGVGLLSLTLLIDLNHMRVDFDIYEEAIKEAQPIGNYVNHRRAVLTCAHCAEDAKEARKQAKEGILRFAQIGAQVYEELGKRGESYKYGLSFVDARDKLSDFDYMDSNDCIIVGDPDICVEKIRRYEEAGAQELIMRLDGYGHFNIMRSIELFGKYVIPQFR